MPAPDIQQLNALAELAAENIQQKLDEYIDATPGSNGLFSKAESGYSIETLVIKSGTESLAKPMCSFIANTVGVGAGAATGGAIGTLVSPTGTITGAVLGAQGGRTVTDYLCNKSINALVPYIWKEHHEAGNREAIEQAKSDLSSRFNEVRNSTLTTLLSNQSAESQGYLRYQFNRNIMQQPLYSLLDDSQKNQIKREKITYQLSLLKKNTIYETLVKQNDRVGNLTSTYFEKVDSIFSQPGLDAPVSPKVKAENDAFFKEWNAKNNISDNQTQHKLNALLHAQKQYNKGLKEVLAHSNLQEKRYQEQLKREATNAIYSGVERGFHFISYLGMTTNNRTIATIGEVGGSITSIAFNAAMISGNIPGIALSGWGLLGPYAAIAMTGLSIISTLLSKKKKDDPQMKALQALSQQMEHFRQDVHRWIVQLGDVVIDAANDIKNTMETNSSVVKTALADGFNKQAVKLEDIQNDLERLTTLSQRGMAANFLQEYSGTVSAIAQYTSNTADRKREIEALLVTLTTWLTDAMYLRNTNGSWCLPEGLTADTVCSSKHLRDHDNLLRSDSGSKLGYLAKLSSLIPGLTLKGVNIEELPNSALFMQAVETYAQGRLHLGSHAAKTMDPNNKYLEKIKEKIENGLGFMQQLVLQEPLVLSFILSHYEHTYAALKTTLISAAHKRLETNTMPGFEFSVSAPLNVASITWPAQLISMAGFTPLPFKKALMDSVYAKNAPFPRVIQSALNAGVGRIVAYYSHSATGASAKAAGGNWNYCHWIEGRTLTFNTIKIGYELNGIYYNLYTASSNAHNEGMIGKTDYWKHKNPGDYDTQNQHRANQMNGADQNPFVATAWNNVSIVSFTESTNQPIPDNLKVAIIEGLVAACIINHPPESRERAELMHNILSHIEILNGLPRDMTSLKALLLQFTSLTNAPVKEQINTLWGEAEFIERAANYQLLGQVISDLRNTMQATPANSQFVALPVVQNLQYCGYLLDAIRHLESISPHIVSAELSEALQIDEEVIFDPQRLQCDITPDNKLGSGGFGEVYRATDIQTGHPLAVKLLYPGAKLMDSARGELEVIARLAQTNHPSSYLVSMLGVTQLYNREAIVMEFVPNGTLADQLYSKNSLSIAYRYQIGKGLIAGLSYLHDQGIIHGDLKDVNVLLTVDFQPKIADYGLARVASDTESRSSRFHSTKTLTGTLLYMAPEFFAPDSTGHPTKKSDIYALGVILWQILTLKKPFAELNPTFQAIAIYWVNSALGRAVPDYFIIPPEPQEPEAANFHRFFAPLIGQCRSTNPENRPIVGDLQLGQFSPDIDPTKNFN